MAVSVWAELAFKAGCVFESHVTYTTFNTKNPVLLFPKNTEPICERRLHQTSDRSQCRDFLGCRSDRLLHHFVLLLVKLSGVDLFSPSDPCYCICVGRLCGWGVNLHLIWVWSSWGGERGVKWLDPDIVACLDGLGTKLYGDREQWVWAKQAK